MLLNGIATFRQPPVRGDFLRATPPFRLPFVSAEFVGAPGQPNHPPNAIPFRHAPLTSPEFAAPHGYCTSKTRLALYVGYVFNVPDHSPPQRDRHAAASPRPNCRLVQHAPSGRWASVVARTPLPLSPSKPATDVQHSQGTRELSHIRRTPLWPIRGYRTPRSAKFERPIKLRDDTMAPSAWEIRGGPGTIDDGSSRAAPRGARWLANRLRKG